MIAVLLGLLLVLALQSHESLVCFADTSLERYL